MIKNSILVNIIEKSQKKLDLKAQGKGVWQTRQLKSWCRLENSHQQMLGKEERPEKEGELWVLLWAFFLLGEKHLLLAGWASPKREKPRSPFQKTALEEAVKVASVSRSSEPEAWLSDLPPG